MSDIAIDVRETDCEVGNLVELAKRLQHTGLQNTITLFDKTGRLIPFKALF
jgi:hypothetical protein